MSRPFIIDDSTGSSVLDAGAKGLVPRDYSIQPVKPFRAVSLPLISRDLWPAMIKAQKAAGRRLSDIRRRGNFGQPIPSLQQGSVGYCWGHGPAHMAMLLRAAMNLPYVPLSAYAVCATVVDGRDEGGWGALAQQFICDKGIPAQAFWAQGDRDHRKTRPGCWENAAGHKITEEWVDAAAPTYDRDMSFDQVATCLLSAIPCGGDYNWWGHHIALLDLVELDPSLPLSNVNRWGINIWNSWGDSWGDMGEGILKGMKAVPDNATAARVITASVE